MLKHWFSALNIGKKIAIGQTLALSVAACGAITGIGIANHHYQRAYQLEADARQEKDTWHRLHIEILQVYQHQQTLIRVIEHPERWPSERAEIFHHLAKVRSAWDSFHQYQRASNEAVDSTEEIAKIEQLAQSHPGFAQHLKGIEQRLQGMESLSEKSLKAAKQELIQYIQVSSQFDFPATSELLEDLVEDADEEYEEAQIALAQAEQLRYLILISSLLVSILLAAGLSIATTQAITHPIQAATQVAQQVTEESNFDLQVPVKTKDEVGQLATALNRLIQQVRELLKIQAQTNQQLTEKAAESQKQAEILQQTLTTLQSAQIQLIQSEKMSALGELVAGVAHEINNPVGFIAGNIEPAKRYVSDLLALISLYRSQFPHPGSAILKKVGDIDLAFIEKDLPSLLTSMEEGANRIMGISISLRTFSRSDHETQQLFDLHEGLDSTVLILRHRLKANEHRPEIKIIKHYQDIPQIKCYPGQLNQVFMNLLANAIDALSDVSQPPKVEPQIESQPLALQIEILTEVTTDWIKIQIKDNGMGMTSEVQQKIFEHLFTTKPVGQGTGLGLSIARQIIVDKHQGQLSCKSEYGQGTTFTIELPL
jgi:two-component system, NtrC family, sensor kinase